MTITLLKIIVNTRIMMMTMNIVMIVVGDYNTHRDDNNSRNN